MSDELDDLIRRVDPDRWLSSLLDLEERAQAMIAQIGRMIEMAHAR